MEFNKPYLTEKPLTINTVPAVHPKYWRTHEIEYLRARWGVGGNTGTTIGIALNRSRNAVAGMAHRLGLSQKDPNAVRTAAQRKAQSARALRPKVIDYKPGELTDLPPEQSESPVAIGELASHHCRWPVHGYGYNMIYCGGHRRGSGPYCDRHQQTARRQYEPR